MGSEVTEADGGEGDETEVGTVQECPALPHLEEEGAADDVDDDEEDGEEDGDGLPGVVVNVLVLSLIIVIPGGKV